MYADSHAAAIAEAIETAVHSGRYSYEVIARASGLTNKGVRKVARRLTNARSDTLTSLEKGLEKLGITVASRIVRVGAKDGTRAS